MHIPLFHQALSLHGDVHGASHGRWGGSVVQQAPQDTKESNVCESVLSAAVLLVSEGTVI